MKSKPNILRLVSKFQQFSVKSQMFCTFDRKVEMT